MYMHKFNNIELITLRPSTMQAKTGAKSAVTTFGTGALHCRADARGKIQGTGAPSCSDA
jgi:hypothetical protein